MFFVFFVLWVIMNGKWTAEIGVFGVIFAALLYAFICAFTQWSPRKDLTVLRKLCGIVRYLGLLLSEIVKANLAVMHFILSADAEVKPKLVRFEAPLKTDAARVALADSITLTPGTITCGLQDGVYTVHCLDESLTEGLSDGAFVQTLSELEKEEKKA